MIIALFGNSATGKTTLAKMIANQLGTEMRNCGDAIRIAAAAANTTIDTLSADIHRLVDQDTVDWCDRHGPELGVIDGRFLDLILGERNDVALVNIRASPAVRASRLEQARCHTFDESDVLRIDEQDGRFRADMYQDKLAGRPRIIIDTSRRDKNECVGELLSFISRMHLREHD